MEKHDNYVGNVVADKVQPTTDNVVEKKNDTATGAVDRKNYAFGKVNFILIAVGMLVVILGFILMSGGGSDENTFDPEIFSARRIKVAPIVCFLGFISIIYAIIRKPKDE